MFVNKIYKIKELINLADGVKIPLEGTNYPLLIENNIFMIKYKDLNFIIETMTNFDCSSINLKVDTISHRLYVKRYGGRKTKPLKGKLKNAK